jgi:salicylate hydroxylase
LEESTLRSPLMDGETVFQTADGTTRIYLMPYSKGGGTDPQGHSPQPPKYMWQLSFPVPDEEAAMELSRRGPSGLKDEALARCQNWHAPIPDILNKTPVELVSGYPVYDRDHLTTEMLQSGRAKGSVGGRRAISDATTLDDGYGDSSDDSLLPVTLLGDAAHPMSPFKGQGANQALLDALSLARSLHRARRRGQSVARALTEYEQEMTARSAKKVTASSAAAQFLHTEVAILEGNVTRGGAAAAAAATTTLL